MFGRKRKAELAEMRKIRDEVRLAGDQLGLAEVTHGQMMEQTKVIIELEGRVEAIEAFTTATTRSLIRHERRLNGETDAAN